MAIVLSDLLTPAEAQVLHDAATALEFEDGKRTAGRIARTVKDNLQAVPCPDSAAILQKVSAALMGHPLFQAVAYPRAVARLLVTRTEGGGHYGDHVDNALMGAARADVSCTLFLSPPDSYAGGELVIIDRTEDRAFKLGQGEAIVYPSTSLHRVEPVTTGSRLVVVGWFTSWVRDPGQREILFDLWQAVAAAETAGDPAQVQRLSRSRSNLLRMWAG
jgi:PKHD-type hydroxylase